MKNTINDYSGSFYKVIAFSAGIHLLFVFILIYSRLLPSKKIYYNPVYTVKLVSNAYPTRAKSHTAAKKIPVAVLPKTQKSAGRMTLPVENKTPGKKALLSAIKHISGELKKQELLNAIHQQAIKKSKASNSNNIKPAIGGTPHSAGITSGSAAQQYYSLIWQKIQSSWLVPANMADRSYGYETVVSITIHKNGTVTNLVIEKSSGNTYFDQTAIRAIKRSIPLPPFPPSWLQKSIDIGIKFSCKEGCK